MPSIVATAIVGSAAIGAGASMYAGSQQAGAAQDANQLQGQMYQQNRADLAPWRATGSNALSLLAQSLGVTPSTGATPGAAGATGAQQGGGTAQQPGFTQAPSSGPYGAFTASPGYSFAYDEGLKATDQGAAARGMLRSGAALKGEQRFGTGLANQEFGNWQNRLAALAGIGQTATTQGVQLGQNYAANSGSLLQDAAASRASGYVGAGNAIGGGLGQYAQYLGSKDPYNTDAGGLYKGSYLAPFNSEAAAWGF